MSSHPASGSRGLDPASPDPRAQALGELSTFLVSGSSLDQALSRIAQITTAAMPAAVYAGVALLDQRGRPSTAVFTDPRVVEIDQGQYDAGLGPCLEAWATSSTVGLPDLDEWRDEYPLFVAAAARHGIRSTLSLPMVTRGGAIGALNLYATVPSGFSAQDETLGVDLATASAVVLSNASAYWEAVELSQQLSDAMVSRAVIEQAKGMLMAQGVALTADDAFALLRETSQRENVKLREIAQRTVDRAPLSGRGQAPGDRPADIAEVDPETPTGDPAGPARSSAGRRATSGAGTEEDADAATDR